MDHKDYLLNKSLGYHLTSTARIFTNRLNQNFKEQDFPVTNEQWMIMIHLWEEDGLTQNKLAVLTEKDQPSVSRLIDNMLKRELVKRVPHPEDRRTNLIYLTEKGKKLQVGLITQAQKTINEASNGISEEQFEVFYEVLGQIKQNLINAMEEKK